MKTIYIFVFLLISSLAYSNQKAVTDTGEVVILNDDKTWKFLNEPEDPFLKLTTNKKHFKKNENSTFLLKSKRNESAFWIDTKKWTFSKSDKSGEAEYQFQSKGADLYAMAIAESIQVDLVALTNIALARAKSAASDIKVLKKEYRIVNNKKVIYMEMSGTIQSIKFTYLGYYYASPKGATQLVVYTGSNLVDRYKDEIHNLLNGLTIHN